MAEGKVYLIGAGPGDPGLITVKGRRYLRRADTVVYDYLANAALLREVRPESKRIFVGKMHDPHKLEQAQINQILIDEARSGRIVARLKGGDPFIFGRGGEEALALAEAGVDFEIVPGVTAAVAVPAYAGIPLTHRRYASDVAFITGHEQADRSRSRLDWDKLARGVGTLVFLMGVKNLANITAELIEHGRPADTPAALVRWGTSAAQTTIVGTLADIAAKVKRARLRPPATLIVGPVVELRRRLQWFEKKPLFGQKIVVTRPRRQAEKLSLLLTEAGAEVFEFPTIKTVPLEDYSKLDKAVTELESFNWLIFTSANGVDYFIRRLRAGQRDIRDLGKLKIAAVGPATARRLKKLNLNIDLIPEKFVAEGLLAAWEKQAEAGGKVLLPRAETARALLPRRLEELGAEVYIAPAYRTVITDVDPRPLIEALSKGQISWLTFTSASTAKNFAALVGPATLRKYMSDVKVAAIGPIAAAAAEKVGIRVDVVAAVSTNEGLVNAIIETISASESIRR